MSSEPLRNMVNYSCLDLLLSCVVVVVLGCVGLFSGQRGYLQRIAAYSVVVVRRVILHAYSMYVCTCFDNQNENNNRGGQNLLSVAHLCRRALSTYYVLSYFIRGEFAGGKVK